MDNSKKLHAQISNKFISYDDKSLSYKILQNNNLLNKNNLLKNLNVFCLNAFATNGTGKTRLSNFIKYHVGNYPNSPVSPTYFSNSTSPELSGNVNNMSENIVDLHDISKPLKLLYSKKTYNKIQENCFMSFITQRNESFIDEKTSILKFKLSLFNMTYHLELHRAPRNLHKKFRNHIPQSIVNHQKIYTSFPTSYCNENKDSLNFCFDNPEDNFYYSLELITSFFHIEIIQFLEQCIQLKLKNIRLISHFSHYIFNIYKLISVESKFFVSILNYLNKLDPHEIIIIIDKIKIFRLDNKYLKTIEKIINSNEIIKNNLTNTLFLSKIKLHTVYNSFFNIEMLDYVYINEKQQEISSSNFCTFASKGEQLILGLIKFSFSVQEEDFFIHNLNLHQNNIDINKDFGKEIFFISDDFFSDLDEQNLYNGLKILITSLKLFYINLQPSEVINLIAEKEKLSEIEKEKLSEIEKEIDKRHRKFYFINLTHNLNVLKCSSKLLNQFDEHVDYKNIIINDIFWLKQNSKIFDIQINYHEIPNIYNEFLSFDNNIDFTKNYEISTSQFFVDFIIFSLQKKELEKQFTGLYNHIYNPIFHLTAQSIDQHNFLLKNFQKYNINSYKNIMQFQNNYLTPYLELTLICSYYCYIYNYILENELISKRDNRFILFKYVVFRKAIETYIFNNLKSINKTYKLMTVEYLDIKKLIKIDNKNFFSILKNINISKDYIDNFINEGIHNPFDMSNLLLIQNIEDEKHVNILINKYAKLYRPEYLKLT